MEEWYIYGSESDGRISTLKPYPNEFTDHLQVNTIHFADQAQPYAMKDTLLYYGPTIIGSYQSNARITGYREYEIKDHLGNVRAVISDVKNPHNLASSISSWTFTAEIRNLSNYYPYGMQIPNGIYSKVDDYGYGYNGMEKDDELKSNGKLYSTKYRHGDVALGTWWKRDPLEMDFAGLSPYTMMGSNPIRFIDPHGLFQEDPNENLSPGEEVGETAEWEGEEVIWDGNSWDYSTGEVIVEAERENYDTYKHLGMEVLGLVNSVVSNAFWQPTNIISVDGMEDFFNVEFTEIQKQYFAEGETEGHLVTLAIVAAEAVAGTALEVGGGVAAIPSGGSSLLVTAAGVTISAHSAGALVVATAKLLEAEQKLDLMLSQGNKNFEKMGNPKGRGGSSPEQRVRDVAVKLKIENKHGFRNFVHRMKKDRGLRPHDNFSWEELMELGEEYKKR